MGAIFFSFFLLQAADADGEQMGAFRFSEFSISPRGSVREPSEGGFELRESWIGFEWKRDESLSAEVSFGTGDLIAPAIWYPAQKNQLQLVQASVQARGRHFDIRAGLLPIPNGYEGSVPEWEWALPQTRVGAARWLTRRDYGLEVRSEAKPFMTSVTLSNGESGANVDQKMWVTGQWRYLNSEGFGILGTAQVGRTDSQSTNGSAVGLVGSEPFLFDSTKPMKLRSGTVALFRKWNRHLLLAEMGRGEILQSDEKNPFAWGHMDVSANLGGDVNILMRYEASQANTKEPLSVVRSGGLGVSITSPDRLSLVTLWANKIWESPQVQNDEALLIFRLNNNYF